MATIDRVVFNPPTGTPPTFMIFYREVRDPIYAFGTSWFPNPIAMLSNVLQRLFLNRTTYGKIWS